MDARFYGGLVMAILALAGCSANRHSIYRHQLNDAPALTTIDAKQRVIVTGTREDGKFLRVCAEPSPDVFSVLAQAWSAGLSTDKAADPKALAATLSAAMSLSEQAGSIPRTQTVNMLREMMYRTCERYLSGGLKDSELALQAIRDQRLMVSILAIEQLTGAVAPKPVSIGAAATATAGASGVDAAVRLDDARKELQARTATQGARQADYDELNGNKKDCEAIATAVAGQDEAELSDELQGKRAKCEQASAELAQANTDRANAQAHYAALAGAINAGGRPVSASGALMTPVAPAGMDSTNAAEAVQVVAEAVKAIVLTTFDQDEYLFACLKVITDPKQHSAKVQESCERYVTTVVEDRRERVEQSLSADGVRMARRIHVQRVAALFDRFWAHVSKGDALDPTRVAAMKTTLTRWPACFEGKASKAEFRECFDSVSSQMQRDLAAGG